MEKAGFDLGPLVWEVRDSVWGPWLEKTGADSWPSVWRNLVSVLVFGVRSSGVTLGLGTQVLLPRPAFVQNPNRSFTFDGSHAKEEGAAGVVRCVWPRHADNRGSMESQSNGLHCGSVYLVHSHDRWSITFLQAPAKRKRPAAAKKVVEERTQDLKYR